MKGLLMSFEDVAKLAGEPEYSKISYAERKLSEARVAWFLTIIASWQDQYFYYGSRISLDGQRAILFLDFSDERCRNVLLNSPAIFDLLLPMDDEDFHQYERDQKVLKNLDKLVHDERRRCLQVQKRTISSPPPAENYGQLPKRGRRPKYRG